MEPHVKFFGVIVSNEFSYGIYGMRLDARDSSKWTTRVWLPFGKDHGGK